MRYEVEVKFRVTEAETFEAAVAGLGGSFGEPVSQIDQYFAHPARYFAETDEALRIRSVGELNFITYKGPKIDATTKTRREIELPMEGGEAGRQRFGELLEALGFEPVAEVRKRRRKTQLRWQEEIVEVVWDEVEGLGRFAELELAVEAKRVAAARDTILSLASALGLGGSERRGYLDMLLESRRNP